MVVMKERKRTVQAKNAHTHTHVQKKKNTSAVLHSTHTQIRLVRNQPEKK